MKPSIRQLKHSVFKPSIFALAVAIMLASACAVGPTYQRPSTPTSDTYKEAQNWKPAAPADAMDRGPWWTLFDDAVLSELATRIELSNQNVAAATAAYAQARAIVKEQRASLFPVVSLSGKATRSGDDVSSTPNTSNYQVSIGGSWEPDVWGRLRRGVDSASASSQASAADLAAARLSAQGELAIDYFSLRQTDAQRALLASTITGYQRTLQITQNRYAASIAAKSDVLQAQTQLANAQAEELGLVNQRAQLEHAIAVLVGAVPANFNLASAPWKASVPEVPIGVPSALLERRPDIAAAERRVAAANEQIGIAKSAYFPSLTLNASTGSSASQVANLFSAPNNLWSLGLSAVQLIFGAGATSARISAAHAARDAATAHYRQTVLTAFQDVEDQLSATHMLLQQQAFRLQASQAAHESETQMLNRYREGQVNYTDVVSAQATALSARRALVQLQAARQTTAVALIQSLGGGWQNR